MIIHREGIDECIANSAELQCQRPHSDKWLWILVSRFSAIGLCKCLKSSSPKNENGRKERKVKKIKMISSKQGRIVQ